MSSSRRAGRCSFRRRGGGRARAPRVWASLLRPVSALMTSFVEQCVNELGGRSRCLARREGRCLASEGWAAWLRQGSLDAEASTVLVLRLASPQGDVGRCGEICYG